METLLIEDDAEDAILFRKAIRESGHSGLYHIERVERLQKAIELLEQKHFDVVVLDLMLPDSTSAMETLETLVVKNPSIPFIILTGLQDDELGLEAVRRGAQDYISKSQLNGQILTRALEYAIERKQSNERLKSMHRELQLEKIKLEEVINLEQGLNTIFEVNKLFDFIIEKTAKILEAERCSLMMIDDKTGQPVMKGSIGIKESLLLASQKAENNIITKFIASHGTPVLVKNIEEDVRFHRKNRDSYKTKSFICAPIKLGDDTIGLINVADKTGGSDVFTETDLKIITTIAQQVAIAIENANLYKELNYLTLTDPLTDMYNFRHFAKNLDQEIRRINRYGSDMCLFLIDVDDFKSYNDTYGHLAGDFLLKSLGKVFKDNLRRTDIACRYAGDEFVVILIHTNATQAKIVANKLMAATKKLELMRPVTLSIGIAAFKDGMDRYDMVQKADVALYQAKKEGKNTMHILE